MPGPIRLEQGVSLSLITLNVRISAYVGKTASNAGEVLVLAQAPIIGFSRAHYLLFRKDSLCLFR
jgi:hypothetical protein